MRLNADGEAVGVKAHGHVKLTVSGNQHASSWGSGEGHQPCCVIYGKPGGLQHAIFVEFHRARDRLFQRAGLVFTAAGVGFGQLKGRLRAVACANQLPYDAVIAPVLEAEAVGTPFAGTKEADDFRRLGAVFDAGGDIVPCPPALPAS